MAQPIKIARGILPHASNIRIHEEDLFWQETGPLYDGETFTNKYTDNPSRNQRRNSLASTIPYSSTSFSRQECKSAIVDAMEAATIPPTKPDYIAFVNINQEGRQENKSIKKACKLRSNEYAVGGTGRVMNPFAYWKRRVYFDYDRFVLALPNGFLKPRIMVGKKRQASCNKDWNAVISSIKQTPVGSNARSLARTKLVKDTIMHNDILRK